MSSGAELPVVVIGGAEVASVEAILIALDSIKPTLEKAGRRLTVIGGIAVMARVALAERATGDLDAAVDVGLDGEATVALLDAAGIGHAVGPPAPQRIEVGGVPVDIIDTSPILDTLDGFEPRDVLFLGGHRFAVETAEPVELRAGSVAVRTHLARSSALVATKLHAVLYRRAQAEQKKASDVFDLFRILQVVDWGVASSELAAVVPLARVVADGLDAALVQDATRAARRLIASGVATMAAIAPGDLSAVGGGFAEGLRDAVGG